MTRRDFVASAALAAAARPQARRPKKVVVAGAGISGLCCAYELNRRGHEVTVLEAAGRAGGHIWTVRDPLADGLYADAGAEHFYRPGYDRFWSYLDEFDLPVIAYPRRDRLVRYIGGKPYTEDMLADRAVLAALGLNQREVDYVARHGWPNFAGLYQAPYLDSFPDEMRPFEAGLNHLDQMSMSDLLRKDGASPAAIGFLGGSGSALQAVWQASTRKRRGLARLETRLFRIRGGNQRVTDAFAARLEDRLRLGCPVTGIRRGETGVTVEYQEAGRPRQMDADYVVLAMPFRMIREIRSEPEWPEAKRHIFQNLRYDLKARVIFQSRTRFWKTDGMSPNLIFNDPDLSDVWAMAEEVPTRRGLLIGQARTASSDAPLARFRALYPGPSEDIEQSVFVDWTRDPWAAACLPLALAPGRLARFWPEILRPAGRVLFASVATDPLPMGLEAGVRAAQRAAEAIHGA